MQHFDAFAQFARSARSPRFIGQLAALTLALTLSSPPARSQCPTTNSPPLMQRTWGGEIRKVFAMTDPASSTNQLVWTVEEGGRIAYSTDGGTTFTYASVPDDVRHALLGIFFFDQQNGWAVGKDGVVLRTTDGGATWFWATTNSGPVLRTNCGVDADIPPYPATLWAIHMADLNNGWLAGEGVLRTTINGGGTWSTVSVDAGGGGSGPHDLEECWEFYDLDFTTVGDGLVGLCSVEKDHGLNGIVFDTTNGTNWTLRTNNYTNSLGVITIDTDFEGWEVEFEPSPPPAGPAVAYLIGGPDGGTGRIFRSSDSGQNWVEEFRTCPVTAALCSSFGTTSCCGNPIGSPCGSTHDDPNTCPTPPPGTILPPLYGLTVLGADEAITVGYAGERYRRQTSPTTDWFEDTDRCEFTGPLNTIASAGSQLFLGGTWGYLFESNSSLTCATGANCYTNLRPDRSENWRMFDASFLQPPSGPTIGWMVGSQNAILKTTNSGCTFQKDAPAQCGVGLAVLRSIDTALVGGAELGVAVGDAGKTWYHQQTSPGVYQWTDVTTGGPTLLGVSHAPGTSSSDFWAVGASSTVRRSNNGGATWSAVSFTGGPSLPGGLPTNVKINAITMLTQNDGFFVGELGAAGVAYRISNGTAGSPTLDDATPTAGVAHLNAVGSRATSAAYAVGDQGVVCRYDSASGRFVAVAITYPASVPTNLRDLYSIELVPTTSEAYAGGLSGLLLHSPSPSIGTSWTFPKSHTSKTIRAVQFFSSIDGYVLGQKAPTEPGERTSDQADGVLLVYR